MRSTLRVAGAVGTMAMLSGPVLSAGLQTASDVAALVRGADRVVVAEVAHIEGRYQRNRFGDRLIVSRIQLRVSETLKGAGAAALVIEVEGGTVGDVTMHVSDIAPLSVGQRAVFLLERRAGDVHVPHRRGRGILTLDAGDRVAGTNLTLDAIRVMARSTGG